MQRRNFLHSAAAVAAAPISAAADGIRSLADGQPTIDVHAYLERWPFGRLPLDNAATLAAALRANGISQAWTGSFEALLHHDLDPVNVRLAKTCRALSKSPFRPVGAVDPRRTGWRETLRRCHEEHRMPGVRLHPDYHGYDLGDRALRQMLEEAAGRGLFVQIAIRAAKAASPHPAVRPGEVDLRPLVAVLPGIPGLRLQLLNAFTGSDDPGVLQDLAGSGVQFDIAMVDESAGIESLLESEIPVSSLVFGSASPCLPPETSIRILAKSKLATSESVAIRCHNVENFLVQV